MNIKRKNYLLLAAGLLITNTDFILTRFITLTDVEIGILKGVGVGLVCWSAFFIVKLKKKGRLSFTDRS